MANVVNGAVLQMVEAATLGLPFEVWKTRMGRFRSETTVQAFKNVYGNGGARAFWSGLDAKMVESATKGAILLVAKEGINDALLGAGVDPFTAGIAAGAGGGVFQTVTMGPCTFLVTSKVTGGNMSTSQRITETWAKHGVKGFYPGGTAIAFRQATNWASRQGFTEGIREQFKKNFHGGNAAAKLTKTEEVTAGIIGGALSCWNHPFEVARIEAQARAATGQPAMSMTAVISSVYREAGMAGLFQGLVPRIGLAVWQTLFMVTGAKIVKETLGF